MAAVNVKDLTAMKKALKTYSPELYKSMNVEIKGALKVIQTTARGYVQPSYSGLSNFNKGTGFMHYDPTAVKRGIVISIGASRRNGNGWRASYGIFNRNAMGAIIETAGRKNPNGQPWDPKSTSKGKSHSFNPNAGEQFIAALNNGSGNIKNYDKNPNHRGRLVFRAGVEDQGRTKTAILQAVQKANAAFHSNYEAGR